MKLRRIIQIFFLLICISVLVHSAKAQAQNEKFVVVIDPGHGGKDPGAVGKSSREKDIVLSVAKRLGNMIEANMPDVKVVYTRKTDVFIPLEQRATIANNNHADLFISIHVNAAKNRAAYGAETFTLGLAKTQANLDVAMAENSVILLEDDYQTKYSGFDPNSIESYIMFEFMMDAYLDNSINFATLVQKEFVETAKRLDRGVRQAGFWVLHRTACTSVLVELGFISNANEELYLKSEKGQKELTTSIYNAFVNYKNSHDKKMGYAKHEDSQFEPETTSQHKTSKLEDLAREQHNNQSQTNLLNSPKQEADAPQLPIYKLQITASRTQLKTSDPVFRGVKQIDFYQEGGFYKYTAGADVKYENINKLRLELKQRFPDAFIIAFLGDKKITVAEARRIKP